MTALGAGRVYPRVCGGTPASRSLMLPESGLSPRVRGNLRIRSPAAAASGSIPACAGEPPSADIRHRQRGVYPRVCGGTGAVLFMDEAASGLSPRVRGNLRRRLPGRFHPGSIPACAGEPCVCRPYPAALRVYPRVCGGTHQVWRLLRGSRVYPRVCGGTTKAPGAKPPPKGLSPRVRGNRPNISRRPLRWRSIPACAGEPVGR